MDANEMTERAVETAEGWQEAGENIRNQAQNWKAKAKDQAYKAGRVADEYVHNYAWWSLAFAAAAGCIVGMLIARSRD